MESDFQRIGGEERLRVVVRAFVDRMAADFVIGFRFEGKDLDRIAFHETEHASGLLGGPSTYTGRSIELVHEPLRIHRGQFQRRIAILRTVLADHHVPDDIIARWVAHDEALEPVVASTRDCLG
jgi:hemoglobin